MAAQLPENKLKSLLHPAPVTRWWFLKIVSWAAMDILATNKTKDWPSEAQAPTKNDMEVILAYRMNSSRFLTEKDRERAAKIRALLEIPTFWRLQTSQAASKLAKLNYWVGRMIPKMMIYHHRRRHLGLDAAGHPF
jgi:hypothetical protein